MHFVVLTCKRESYHGFVFHHRACSTYIISHDRDCNKKTRGWNELSYFRIQDYRERNKKVNSSFGTTTLGACRKSQQAGKRATKASVRSKNALALDFLIKSTTSAWPGSAASYAHDGNLSLLAAVSGDLLLGTNTEMTRDLDSSKGAGK